MSELTAMMNIGKEMEKKLISVGIGSSEKLIEVGAKDAFLKLKQKYPNVCLVHLYTLEGAIHDTEYNRLPEDTKRNWKNLAIFWKNNSNVDSRLPVSCFAGKIGVSMDKKSEIAKRIT